MNAPRRFTLILPLLLGLLAGCSARPGTISSPSLGAGGTRSDNAQVASEIAANPSFVDEEVSQSQDPVSLGSGGPADGASSVGVAAAIRPLTFWRTIRDVQRSFEFAFADTDTSGRPTTAVVTVHKVLTGSFNLLVADSVPEGSPPQGHVIRKPLVDRWVRRLLLKRVPLPEIDRSVWRIAAISGVRVTSKDAASRIESLRIQSGALDTTVTEPLAFFRLRRILKLEPDAEVTLTATTLRSDDVLLLYLRDRRMRFVDNGDDTYTATFQAPDVLGLHHLGVNVLSHGTLFDEQAPYDSQSWILPYLVHPIQLAAGTPAD